MTAFLLQRAFTLALTLLAATVAIFLLLEVVPGDPALTVNRVSVRDSRGLLAVDDVSLEVRSGEIVGIAGVAGNGQRALTDAIAGLEPGRALNPVRTTVNGPPTCGAADLEHPR